MKQLVIPIFIPHMGCPHTCAFCNQKKIAGDYKMPDEKFIIETVELYTGAVKTPPGYIELAFYGGSFTGIDANKQEELLKVAWNLKQQGKIHHVRLSTRPDYINPETIDRLNKYEVGTVELGVQSLDPQVLEFNQRGHFVEDVLKAVKMLKLNNKKVGIQLMPGLPGDSWSKAYKTALLVVEAQPDFVRIYPTVIIKDTQLEEWYRKGYYVPLTLEEAVELSAEMLIVFEKADIPVIRIGLQAQENLREDKDLVAGPYHPAFGELVKSRVFRKKIELLLFVKNTKPLDGEVIIICHPQQISQVKGQNKANIRYFNDKYNLQIKVLPLPSLSLGFLGLSNQGQDHYLIMSRREFYESYRNNKELLIK